MTGSSTTINCASQIEFNFRDAKQFWGLEDFMNVKERPIANAVGLSLFMVNLSHYLLQQMRQTIPMSASWT